MIIKGKRGFGLWLQQYSEGIGQGLFTKHEILGEFNQRNIIIPESLLRDFNNRIWNVRSSLEENNKQLIELDKEFKLKLYHNKKDEVTHESKD